MVARVWGLPVSFCAIGVYKSIQALSQMLFELLDDKYWVIAQKRACRFDCFAQLGATNEACYDLG